MTDGFLGQIPDVDPDETAEWIDSFESVAQQRGRARASFLLARLAELRTAGAVPLVTDPRWSAEQSAAVERAVERAA